MTPDFWNERYSENGFAYGTEPNVFLVESRRYWERKQGKALAVADGEGRNGVWLAKQGFDVLSVDASQAGLEKAQALAQRQQVSLRTLCVDLTAWTWPRAEFALVASIYVHFPEAIRKSMHRAMWDALAPGGILVLEAFRPEQVLNQYPSGGPRTLDMLYTLDMLRADFVGAEILFADELVTYLLEGKYHCGEGAVVRLVLRKPA
ncbi:MAG: class I SAM-dependent methyltransferase [Gammaproteobacteria bacterium]|nr:class I SAM-dependent methyltransferase [Gammaproteobacteria bacterium]